MTGERLIWMEIADRKRMCVQECMDKTTSTEFVDWSYFYQEKERNRLKVHDKMDYGFALVAYKVNQVLEVLCDAKKRATLQDMLLRFKESEGGEGDGYTTVKVPNYPKHDPYKPLPRDADGNLIGGIEIGVTPLNERWQKVNDNAKLAIGAMLGVPLEALADGNRTGT